MYIKLDFTNEGNPFRKATSSGAHTLFDEDKYDGHNVYINGSMELLIDFDNEKGSFVKEVISLEVEFLAYEHQATYSPEPWYDSDTVDFTLEDFMIEQTFASIKQGEAINLEVDFDLHDMSIDISLIG